MRVAGFGQVMPFVAPSGAPAEVAPRRLPPLVELVVAPAWRHRGIGEALTRTRMGWVAQRADAVWCFANARKRATLDLHRRLGFAEVSRRFTFPGVTFAGRDGVLLRARLSSQTTEMGWARLRPG